MIAPQISMPVIYTQADDDRLVGGPALAGVIARVWTDSCVNLVIFDGNGLAHNRTSVQLLQEDAIGKPLPAGRWCQFPDWFVAFTKPPALLRFPVLGAEDLERLGCARPGSVLLVRATDGTLDPVRCSCDPMATLSPGELAGCQPTRQVIG